MAEAQAKSNYPDYDKPIKSWHPFEKLLHYFSYAALFATILCLGIAGKWLENIVDGMYFIYLFGGVGLLLASLAMLLIKLFYPVFFNKKSESRAAAVLGLFFSIVFWSIFMAAIYNAETAQKKMYKKRVYVVNKSINKSKGTPYVWMTVNGKEERFSPKQNEWERLEESDSTTITVGKGAIGFEHIIKFIK